MKRSILLLSFFAFSAIPASSEMINVNLLDNPGFEAGLTSWVTDHGAIRNALPLAHSGDNYLMGANDGSPTSYTYQEIDLIAEGFDSTQIDSGLLEVHYGGYQAGFDDQSDRGKIEILFNDGVSSLGFSDLPWVSGTWRTWHLREDTVGIPMGTRSITYGFHAERFDQFNTDGYLDDAFLQIVPEPATLSLLAIGTLSMFQRRKKT